jgi:hypothetical protein
VRCLQQSVEANRLEDFTDEVSLNLDVAGARRTVEQGFNYRREIEFRPGAHTLKVAVCDRATGRLGSLRITLPKLPLN